MIKFLKKGISEKEDTINQNNVSNIVSDIINDIQTDGDKAVRELSIKFDNWEPDDFKLTKDQINLAIKKLPNSTIDDIKYAQKQVRNFAEIQKNSMSDVEIETLPGVAQVALQMGKHVSKQIQNDLNNVERKAFNYKDLGEMATIGKSKAVVDILNLKFGGVIAWLIWLFVHLIAITNFKNKLMIFTQWSWCYLTSQRHSRIIR